jgi:hypothetical protein
VFFMFHVKFVHYMLKKTSVSQKAVDVSAFFYNALLKDFKVKFGLVVRE